MSIYHIFIIDHFVDSHAPDVRRTNETGWFEENHDALVYFSILGSPPPNLTCIDNNSKEVVLSCSRNQMRDILYRKGNKPCTSRDGKYSLSSQSKQSERVKLFVSNVNLERNNGVLLCRIMNLKNEKKNFRLDVNVKGWFSWIF